jgi:Copper type II ascorbate-dependent monooxygenase, C-terminal domain
MRHAPFVGVLLLLFGCSTSPTQSYTVSFPTLTVPPGVENTQCVVLRLGNPDKLHVGQIHNLLGEASHHMIVYRVNDTVEQPTPFDCAPFVDTLDSTKGAPLMITQKKDELLDLPSGVAYTLEPNQMVRLEMHYINATQAPVSMTASTTMISSHTFHDEANFLFIGNPDIRIAPSSQFTLGPTFFKLDEDTFGDAKFFALTGHEHKFGTNVTVAAAANADDAGTVVYDVPNWVWSEPATVFHDPPFSVPTSGGFKFTCDWNNTSSNTVKFGESANNEMCFFWAYYYPSKGAYVCIHTAQGGGHDFCCPGAVECAFIQQVAGM